MRLRLYAFSGQGSQPTSRDAPASTQNRSLDAKGPQEATKEPATA